MLKLKFRPRITRVKLNPEQAVLACSCYNTGRLSHVGSGSSIRDYVCNNNLNWQGQDKRHRMWDECANNSSSSSS